MLQLFADGRPCSVVGLGEAPVNLTIAASVRGNSR